MKQMLHLRKKGLKRAVLLILLAVLHCNNTALYDEALTTYPRIIRPGLREWNPLNGNLSSRIGGTTGTATGVITAGANRMGESAKAVCVTASEIDFTSANFRSSPGTIGAWIKFNTAPVGSILQNGSASTTYIGFRVSQTGGPAFALTYGNGGGISGGNFTTSTLTPDIWYYLAFAYGSGVGTFYLGPHGGSLAAIYSSVGPYGPDNNPLRFFLMNTNGCIDDLVAYDRGLSADEVKENFLTLE